MQNYVKELITSKYGESDISIQGLGGGFYGRVFHIQSNDIDLILKFYLKKGLCLREKQQLNELQKSALLKVPEVYDIHYANEQIPYDVLFMEFIPGVNAGTVDLQAMKPEIVRNIANQLVDNLISVHSYIHKEGFGEIASLQYYDDWRDYYKPIAKEILQKAESLYKNKLLNDECINTMRSAYQNFSLIFSEPIRKASLIHGDYNTLNLMLSKDCSSAAAMIDPYNCCYGDPEYDLYQLNNVNGKEYGLLDLYQTKQTLSSNWREKTAFYELFTEIMHYYDSGVTPDLDYLKPKVENLRNVLSLHNN